MKGHQIVLGGIACGLGGEAQRAGVCSALLAVYSYLWEGKEQAEPDFSEKRSRRRRGDRHKVQQGEFRLDMKNKMKWSNI